VDVERLLAEEEAGWGALQAAFARVADDRFEESTLTPDGWSPKDAMFHVGYWLTDCADVLDEIRAGTFDPGARPEETWGYIDGVNDEGFHRSRMMPPQDVRTGYADARARAVEAFRALPEVTRDAWGWFEESGPLHYSKHEADLMRWLGQ